MPALIFAPLGWNRCCGNLPHYQSSRAKKCCNKNLAKEGPADHARHAPFVVRLLPSTRRVSHGGGRGATCGRGPLHAPFWYARVGLGVGYSQVSRTGGSARNWRSPALCPAFVTMPVAVALRLRVGHGVIGQRGRRFLLPYPLAERSVFSPQGRRCTRPASGPALPRLCQNPSAPMSFRCWCERGQASGCHFFKGADSSRAWNTR